MPDYFSNRPESNAREANAGVERNSESSKPKASSNKRDGKMLSIRSPIKIVQDKNNPGWTRPAEEQPISGDGSGKT